MRGFTKDDITYHSDGIGRGSQPAVNVKVRTFDMPIRQVAEDTFPDDVEAIEAWWAEEGDAILERAEWLFGLACESGWDDLQERAMEIWDSGVEVYSEGRSGGWAVVKGLPDPEEWDAIALDRWARFARYAREVADDIPYRMADLAVINIWHPEHERLKTAILA